MGWWALQVKTLPCKEKDIQQHPETLQTSLGPSSSAMDRRKVEKCAVVWPIHISDQGCRILWAKAEKIVTSVKLKKSVVVC